MSYPPPGDDSPTSSSALTGPEFTPDDDSDDTFSDDDKERHSFIGGGGGGKRDDDGLETYELVTKKEGSWRTAKSSPRRGRDAAAAVAGVGNSRVAAAGHGESLAGSGATHGDRASSEDASSVESFQLYTPDEELAVRTKFDRRLVLFVALLYMLSFLDRSNIGNARIAGMDQDLQSDPPRDDWYQWALLAFYLPYIAFEWMSLLWRIVPAHVFVSLVVLTWGLTASLQAVAVSYPMLIALRVLLGIGEAGFTGIPFYLSFFFKRRELAFRTAIFISAAPLATSFASTLAWIIVRLAQFSPIAPWRLLFLIEGFPSVIVAVIAWSVIPDSPQTASYLTKREKRVALLRLRHEKPTSAKKSSAKKKKDGGKDRSSLGDKIRSALVVLRDPVSWLTPAMFFLANMAYSSLPVFLPKIVTEMGHGTLTSQALCVPPYLLAFFVVLFTAHMSDRLGVRTTPIVFHALSSSFGYAVLALSQVLHLPHFIRYLALYPAAIGFFNVVTLVIAWNINNQATEGSRSGGGFALLQLIGQCGPLVGTTLYPDRDAPYYTPGMRTCALAMLGVAVLAVILRFYLQHLNRKLDEAAEKEAQGGSASRIAADGPAVEEEGLVNEGKKKRQADPFRYML